MSNSRNDRNGVRKCNVNMSICCFSVALGMLGCLLIDVSQPRMGISYNHIRTMWPCRNVFLTVVTLPYGNLTKLINAHSVPFPHMDKYGRSFSDRMPYKVFGNCSFLITLLFYIGIYRTRPVMQLLVPFNLSVAYCGRLVLSAMSSVSLTLYL